MGGREALDLLGCPCLAGEERELRLVVGHNDVVEHHAAIDCPQLKGYEDQYFQTY